MGTLLSLAPIVGNMLPLPNKDVDSATQKNNNYQTITPLINSYCYNLLQNGSFSDEL